MQAVFPLLVLKVIMINLVVPLLNVSCLYLNPQVLSCNFSTFVAIGSTDDVNDSRHYSASVDSHMSMSTIHQGPFADIPGSREPYPAWSAERQIPISTEEIEDIFLDLTHKFGFQKDSMRNMVSIW